MKLVSLKSTLYDFRSMNGTQSLFFLRALEIFRLSFEIFDTSWLTQDKNLIPLTKKKW